MGSWYLQSQAFQLHIGKQQWKHHLPIDQVLRYPLTVESALVTNNIQREFLYDAICVYHTYAGTKTCLLDRFLFYTCNFASQNKLEAEHLEIH